MTQFSRQFPPYLNSWQIHLDIDFGKQLCKWLTEKKGPKGTEREIVQTVIKHSVEIEELF